MKRFAFNISAVKANKREEADWTLLLAEDKISVPGAQKQFSSNKKRTKNLHFHENSRNFSRTDLQAKMVSLELILCWSVCNHDSSQSVLKPCRRIDQSQNSKQSEKEIS